MTGNNKNIHRFPVILKNIVKSVGRQINVSNKCSNSFHYSNGPYRRYFTEQKVIMWKCLCLTSLFNIWGHITTVPACSSGTLTNVLPHRNAMLQTGHDTQPSHSIQTRGRPVAVLSIDVERHTGMHSYPF